MKTTLSIAIIFLVSISLSAQKIDPSFEQVLSLSSVSNPVISPDGKHTAYTMSTTDWENNRYDREIYLSKNGNPPFRLTNTPEGNSYAVSWSPDSKWIAFLSGRADKSQIFIINVEGGEAIQVSHIEDGVNDFEWSPDGSQIAFLQFEDNSKKKNSKKELYGGYTIEDQEFDQEELWIIPFSPEKLLQNPTPTMAKDSVYKESLKPTLLLGDSSLTITDFLWSPDGSQIAINHQPNSFILSFMKSDISILDIETKELSSLVKNESSDGLIDWSPDGKSILYGSDLDNSTSNFYKNNKIFRINTDGSNCLQLAADFDENIGSLSWTKNGIFGVARLKTQAKGVQIDPNTGNTLLLDLGLERSYNFDFSEDGQKLSLQGNNDNDLTEIYTSSYPFQNVVRVSNSSSQIENWNVSHSEVITWKSKDGTEIEGVLHKPANFDPSKKYPLLVAIHGGPTGTSLPRPINSYVYPINQWLNKGAIVLQPNYRGSAGYGEAFRSLNVENLGIGDAWDIESGVEHLINLGIANADKVGSMGWSQGGYISAFLSTNSDKFKAISVGAGISNWMTYYVSTDITPFTRQYLNATPWSNKEIYEKTSPMTNINQAQTPTLIQHGEFDRRVPTSNAYELYQGLLDVGVDTELIIYEGFGHGITKPKERLAAVWHNWKWFGKYIWEEEIEIPME